MKQLIAALALALAACGPPQTYTQANQDAFMRGCSAQGAPESYCSCVYQKVTQSVSPADFAGYERMSEADREKSDVQSRLRQFAMQCSAQNQQSPQIKPGG